MPEPTKPRRSRKKPTSRTHSETRRRAESERPARVATKEPEAPRVSPLFQKLKPSAELAPIVGKRPLTRIDAVKKLWRYIKREALQNPKNKRLIDLDEKLRPVFDGREQVSLFELTNGLMRHLSAVPDTSA